MKSSSTRKVLFTFVISMFLLIALTVPAFGATSGGSGDDRWVNLQIEDETLNEEYSTEVNITIPEVISTNHTLSGTFEHTRPTGYNGSIESTVSITFANETGTTTSFTWESGALTANTTTDFTIDTNLEPGEYNVTSVSLSDTGAGATDEYDDGLDVNVLSNSAYTIGHSTIQLIASIIPLIVIVVVVIPIILNLFKGIDKDIKKKV